MKLKNFEDYLKKRLDENEITQIQKQADLECKILATLQKDVSRAIDKYMKKEKIGFNELVRRLDVSPTQIHKIQKGEANLTLASLAHIAALFNKRAHIVFDDR